MFGMGVARSSSGFAPGIRAAIAMRGSTACAAGAAVCCDVAEDFGAVVSVGGWAASAHVVLSKPNSTAQTLTTMKSFRQN
jgi:hypothetical protein